MDDAERGLAWLDERIEAARGSIIIRGGAWLDQQQFPPLRFVVPGVLPEGFSLLVGPPKAGKSWLALSIALAAASGGRALGLAVDQRPVLYLALEDSDRRLQDRCRKLLADGAIPPGFEFATRAVPAEVLPAVRDWLALHAERAPIAIIDTLGRVLPPAFAGESSYQRDYRIGAELHTMAAEHPGASVLVNHHTRKAESSDFVDRVSGTNGLAGAADAVLVLARDRGEHGGVLSITGRDVHEAEYGITFDAASGIWTLDGGSLAAASAAVRQAKATDGLDDRSRAVVKFVAERPHGVTAAQVADEVDIPADQARRYLARLCESGRITKAGRGVYVPVGLSQASQVSHVDDEHGTEWDTGTLGTPIFRDTAAAYRMARDGE